MRWNSMKMCLFNFVVMKNKIFLCFSQSSNSPWQLPKQVKKRQTDVKTCLSREHVDYLYCWYSHIYKCVTSYWMYHISKKLYIITTIFHTIPMRSRFQYTSYPVQLYMLLLIRWGASGEQVFNPTWIKYILPKALWPGTSGQCCHLWCYPLWIPQCCRQVSSEPVPRYSARVNNPANRSSVSEIGISSPNSSFRQEVCWLVATRFLLHPLSFPQLLQLRQPKYCLDWWFLGSTYISLR